MALTEKQREQLIPRFDLSAVKAQIVVLADEPHTLRIKVTLNGNAVDLATDYPSLVSRTKQGTGTPVDSAVTVENFNEAVMVIPQMTYDIEAWWELRDTAGDSTWLRADLIIDQDDIA